MRMLSLDYSLIIIRLTKKNLLWFWFYTPGLVQSRSGVCARRVLCEVWGPGLPQTPLLPERPSRAGRGWHHDRPHPHPLQLRLLRLTCSRKQVGRAIVTISQNSLTMVKAIEGTPVCFLFLFRLLVCEN